VGKGVVGAASWITRPALMSAVASKRRTR
jgi:hypothetical protein